VRVGSSEETLSRTLFRCDGGSIGLPDPTLVLVDRHDGGTLVVVPPRDVWERSELSPSELTLWSFLVAATGKAMLDVLPQLEGGCINYWEAGNWALNDQAEPPGPKTAREYRKVHLHLLGRSTLATNPSWRWGEAPIFPYFVNRYSWAATNEPLNGKEVHAIVARVEELLRERYSFDSSQIGPRYGCQQCGYPSAIERGPNENACSECANLTA